MRDRRIKRIKNDPMLLGEPSPSLSALEKMNMVKLAQRAERLADEVSRMSQKIERLKKVRPLPEQQISQLAKSLVRLKCLQKAASDKLTFKTERKRKWDEHQRLMR
jgi:hypothetical protein